MARFHLNPVARRAAFAASALALLALAWLPEVYAATHAGNAITGATGSHPTKDTRKLPIDVASTQVDYQGNSVVFKDVVITQGDTRVQADHAHATGLDDFDNSHWTFEGNVRINGEQHGSLKSDHAIVEFRNNHISKATITGTPAEFEQQRADSDQVARGHAKEIVYNVTDGTVRLSEDAWLSDGRNEISGSLLVYNIREQHIQASTQQGKDDRVHILITPHANDEPEKKP